METQFARSLPIIEVCYALGLSYEKDSGGNTYFKSPRIPGQRTGSLSVSASKAVWKDYATDEAGDAIRLVEYVLQCDFKAAMAWFDTHLSSFSRPLTEGQQPVANNGCSVKQQELGNTVLHTKPLYSYALKEYLESRKIPVALATKYVCEVHYRNKGGKFYAIGFRSDVGGYELRSAAYKTSTMPKGVKFIKGRVPSATAVVLFEGFMDFLSALVWFNLSQPTFDTIVLNGTGMVTKIQQRIGDYREVRCFLDTDRPGVEALRQLQSWHPNVTDKSTLYSGKFLPNGRPMKDFNDLLVAESHLRKLPLLPNTTD